MDRPALWTTPSTRQKDYRTPAVFEKFTPTIHTRIRWRESFPESKVPFPIELFLQCYELSFFSRNNSCTMTYSADQIYARKAIQILLDFQSHAVESLNDVRLYSKSETVLTNPLSDLFYLP